ncbi:DUF1254 domain-containing protein [Stenotrophomonas sp. SY1]|uniref:DUF1254 domain-containing protein n=1 Tax=Stenotrophomonas sp. SY1 TaxID=477235 RepID=UPI001E31E18A|nr:DUF1254 domain-containing protein [Stenotrophomonas sp. SY1]MCD9085714.1 DUF1254 domain-containing protein [Stenotrophomonas sp. SY1]
MNLMAKHPLVLALVAVALVACTRDQTAAPSAPEGRTEVAKPAPADTSAAASLSEQEAYAIAKDAYVYAYPAMLTYATVRKLSNFAEPKVGDAFGPPNQFHHALAYPNAEDRIVIRTNVDTLYSAAVLDLKAEPQVLSVPATDRYFQLPMLSLWTDVFAVPGTRTTGKNTARDFLVVAPEWKGDAPSNVEVIRSPTRYVWIIGRTQTNGAADYGNVHAIQNGYKLRPQSAWGKGDYTPPKGTVDASIDMRADPPMVVDKMDATSYYAQFAELLKDNPPTPVDYPMVHRLERTGFRVGQGFDLAQASPTIRQAFERGYADGRALVKAEGDRAAGKGGKGWVYTTRSGTYGTDYLYRAAIAQCCVGENLPQDAVYPALSSDSEGRPLDGNHAYVLHFEKDKWPPVDAFWSVTAYDADGYFIPNAIKRQAIGDRDKLVANADGSLDLYIQADSPGADREGNWLPVAKAPFTLLLRLYSPREVFLEGNWAPPPAVRQ